MSVRDTIFAPGPAHKDSSPPGMMIPSEFVPPALHPSSQIAIGLSGGVDSAVAALLLRDSKYPLFAVYLRLWHHPSDDAAAARFARDEALAERVAEGLNIPFHVIDARETFRTHVVETFIQGYTRGETPNPCVHCNHHVRWGFMLDEVQKMGASHLATGHYARLKKQECIRLYKGVDQKKDQSYMLSFLRQDQVARAMFPLGDLTKEDVRKLAAKAGIAAADRPDSQDLCFIGDDDYRTFLQKVAPDAFHPGPILDIEGHEIGRHHGLGHFTIGQRKGIGIALPHPLYVVEKDSSRNALIVGPRESLGRTSLHAGPMHWIAGEAPPLPGRFSIQTRYTAPEVEADIVAAPSGCIHATLTSSIPDITPGQAAVLYRGEECLGGGIIHA